MEYNIYIISISFFLVWYISSNWMKLDKHTNVPNSKE